ncbi:MAG: efflux RND transporter periplasmic adaptor subunit [bacterium]
MKKRIIIITAIVLVVAVGLLIFLPTGSKVEEDSYITTEVTSQHITQSITATGTVEPVTIVDVGTQVSGILTTLYVDYNSEVTKGQVIAELDKSTLLLDLNSNKNSVMVAESKYNYELANYTRIKALHEKELISDSEYETALYTYESARNSLEISKNDLKRSETNLGYATIYSPIDGVVISKDVEEGQTVASSFSTPTLFTIAADLKDMQVIADVDEADIGNVEVGQKCQFQVDAYPSLTFEGVVTQIRQEGVVESNVVTYEVVISAANPDLKLKPGLTANIEIFILDVECNTVVPVAALTFTPDVEGIEIPSVLNGETANNRPERQRPEGENMNGERPERGNGERPDRMGGERPNGDRPSGMMGGDGSMRGERPERGEEPQKERTENDRVRENTRSAADATENPQNGIVWILNDEEITPRLVTIGVSNGILTQVTGLNVGDLVVTGIKEGTTVKVTSFGAETTNPFMPQRPGQKK